MSYLAELQTSPLPVLIKHTKQLKQVYSSTCNLVYDIPYCISSKNFPEQSIHEGSVSYTAKQGL